MTAVLGVLGLVETEQDEIVHRAARLRRAEGVDELDIAGERIGLAVIVGLRLAEKSRQVAEYRETETRQFRVHRRVAELVEPAGPEDARITEVGAYGVQSDRRQTGVGVV
jgi:hypothetical protein